MNIEQLIIQPKPAPLSEVLDDDSAYNKRVAYETKLVNSAHVLLKFAKQIAKFGEHLPEGFMDTFDPAARPCRCSRCEMIREAKVLIAHIEGTEV